MIGFVRHCFVLMMILPFSFRATAQNRFVDSMIHWIETHPRIDSEYVHTLHRISYRLSEKDIHRSFAYYERVAALSDSLHFTFGKSLAQINLGILLYNSGNFESSNNAYFHALEEAEACGALRLKAVSLNNIGENFRVLKDYSRCRKYTLEALALNTRLKAWRGMAINEELLFTCDFNEGRYHRARSILLEGMPFAVLSGESYILSQFYLDFGKLQAIDHHDDSANIYFDKALTQAWKETDLKNLSQAYLAKAQYLQSFSPKEKIKWADSALQISRRNNNSEGIAMAAQQLSTLYDSLKNRDSSLYFFQLYRTAADSLYSENNRRNVLLRESEWTVRRKELENRNLKQLAQLQKKEISIKNGLLILVALSLLFILVLAFSLYKWLQIKRKRKEEDFQRKITETEMQVLRAQMNPHFLFNSLNAINRFILQNNKASASEYLTKFSRLVRLILQNSQVAFIPLEGELEALELYLELEAVRFDHHFDFTVQVEEDLDLTSIKIPPLIIQPYAENAIWHGLMHKQERGHLDITLTQKEHMLLCRIRDDGIGRKMAAALKSNAPSLHQSLGMKITAERIARLHSHHQAGSHISIRDLILPDGSPGGTEVLLKIPVHYD